MKKLVTLAIASGLLAMPAVAASITLSFAGDNGITQVWTFDGEGTATTGALTTTYTWDEEARILCADVPDQGEVCATFETTAQAVGESSAYTLSTGDTGTATITAISE